MYERIGIIQKALNSNRGKVYLEIGVREGYSFIPIRAQTKIAVDPQFKNLWLIKLLSKLTGKQNRYFETTSNDFFAKQKEWLEENGLDVVFVDGLHNFKQSLKDVENSLKYLNEDGVIIIHDCNPITASCETPVKNSKEADIQCEKPVWNGDVWKTIVYLRSTRNDLQVCVLDTDFGLGVVKKGRVENTLSLTRKKIDKMTYEDLHKDREKLLNLKPASFFNSLTN